MCRHGAAGVLWAFLIAFSTWAADQLVADITAEGHGIGANKAEALMAAKRDAIEKGIGVLLVSQTEVENFMLKRDLVITKTLGAVRSYEVLSEKTEVDGSYEMSIRAVLSRSVMREDLAAFQILIESMGKPRVMVVIAEENVGSDQPANDATEQAVCALLRDPYEFDIVDPTIASDIKKSQQKMAALEGDPKAAASIGAQYGAEVIITGKAISREAKQVAQNLGGMLSVQADITLKAINVSNARTFATASGHGAAVHLSPNSAGNMAFEKAAKSAVLGDRAKSVTGLLDAIVKEWQNQLNNGVTIRVTVKNVGNFRLKNNVIHTLSSLANIGAARERGWNAESKMLEVDVQYKGNVDGFCSRLDGYKLRDGGGSLSVTSVNGLAVTLNAQEL